MTFIFNRDRRFRYSQVYANEPAVQQRDAAFFVTDVRTRHERQIQRHVSQVDTVVQRDIDDAAQAGGLSDRKSVV